MNINIDEKKDKFIFCTEAKSGYEHHPGPTDSIYCSTQTTLTHSLILNNQAPPCEKILSYTHSLRIQHAKAINSIEITDGRALKGKKLIITGIIKIKIEYLSCHDTSQKAYFYSWEHPFHAVLLHTLCDHHKLFSLDFNLEDFMVYGYIEYLHISCKTESSLETTVALRIWLQELSHHMADRDDMDMDCIKQLKEGQQ